MIILAVDDEKNVLRVLKEAILEARPEAEVFATQKPEEAVEYARNHSVDVAFLDINIGSVNGLDLGLELREIYPELNLVFVTSYSEYGIDAVKLHASGYVMKPVLAEDIDAALKNLIHPVENTTPEKGIFAHTFGNFDLYIDGECFVFPLSKSKEMLAYLIDKEGSTVTRKELAAAMFEKQEYSRQVQDYLSKIYNALKKALEEANAGQMLVKGRNQYSVDPKTYRSDVRDFYNGESAAEKEFRGAYMAQYSNWSDDRLYELIQLADDRKNLG